SALVVKLSVRTLVLLDELSLMSYVVRGAKPTMVAFTFAQFGAWQLPEVVGEPRTIWMDCGGGAGMVSGALPGAPVSVCPSAVLVIARTVNVYCCPGVSPL